MGTLKEIKLLRIKNAAKLEKMVRVGEEYSRILRQSRLVDKYLSLEMKIIEENNAER